MNQPSLKDLVVRDKNVTFQYFRRGQLWYQTECGFLFAVPVEDVGDATFNATEPSTMMMRYIRKQLEANKAGAADSVAA